MISIAEDEEKQKHTPVLDAIKETIEYTSFYHQLKEMLSELDSLPRNEVKLFVQSPDFKDDRDNIEKNFWKHFGCISKDNDSLDSAILLQSYGFTLNKKVNDDLIVIEEETEDETDTDEESV
jgi:hypothetical protein